MSGKLNGPRWVETPVLLASAIDKMERYGRARSRAVDHEVREVTLTDDEAVAVLRTLGALSGGER